MLRAATALAVALIICHNSEGVKANPEISVSEQTCKRSVEGQCEGGSTTRASPKIDITCDALAGNQIDWDCVFGPESLEEVFQRGGIFTTCPTGSKAEPYSRFIVAKDKERSEVKVQKGPEGFPFLKGERYIFKYSFRAVEGMKVAKRFTHLGQLKGSAGGYMIKGDPIYSLTVNNNGLMVRFSNLESIEDYHHGMEEFLPWEDATGDWVNVEIDTTFGESMEVNISGAVKGRAVWPKNLKPVAWHRDSEMVRMKLGLYHSTDNVYDGEVEYKNISIEGPNGIIRTSSKDVAGAHLVGCFKDKKEDRVLKGKYVSEGMTAAKCAKHCEGDEYFGTQYRTECWCGDADTDIDKHGKAKCDNPCAGKPGEICGGVYAISMYHNGGGPISSPKDARYVGCFGDKSDRALTYGTPITSTNMTYEKCLEYCGGKGSATHTGLQYGEECFCGNADDYHTRHGEAVCHMQCTGDSNAICGGPYAMTIFRI